jgi:hypothetical protein
MKKGLEGISGFIGCIVIVIAAMVLTVCLTISTIFKGR